MKEWKKAASLILSAGMMASMFTGAAWASETRSKISSVTLRIDADVVVGETGGSLSIEIPESAHYSVKEYEFDDDSTEWSAGDKPKVEITLTADDDYYFTSSPSVTLKGDDATVSSKKREDDNETLIVTIRLDALESNYELDEIEWLSESSPVATWTDDDKVAQYQVRLYRNGSSVDTSVTTSSTYYDFASKITRTGDYTFRVRSYKSTSKHGDWYESESLYVDDDLLAKIKSGNYSTASSSSSSSSSSYGPGGTTTQNSVVSTSGATFSSYWFQDTDGSWKVKDRYGNLVTNCWLCDDAVSGNGQNIWYLLDASGNMVSGALVRDSLGNYYSLETEHNGYYGMLRYASGTYGAITLSLESQHNGRFGAINNSDAINALNAMYGTIDISSISTECRYTSQF
jgi:hypothetical protein